MAVVRPDEFRDRRGRLILFGALAVVVGAGALALGCAYLLLPLAAGRFAAAGLPVIAPRVAMSGALTWGLLGGAAIWAGIGSIRRRPWARSAMLSLAWSWLAGGILVVIVSALTIDGLMSAGAGIDPEVADLAKWLILAVEGMGGVALPALFVWAYTDRDVERTCAAARTAAGGAWDDCPPAVFGLVLGLGAMAVLSVPLALQPVVPVFGLVVTGWPGAALTLVGGAASGLLARALLRRRRAALWGTAALLLLVGASCAVTVRIAGYRELLRNYGYPEAQLAVLPQSTDDLVVWGTVILTVASLGYVAVVGRRFRGPLR